MVHSYNELNVANNLKQSVKLCTLVLLLKYFSDDSYIVEQSYINIISYFPKPCKAKDTCTGVTTTT